MEWPTGQERPLARATVADDADQLKHLVSQVFEQWQLEPPDIIISIVSGVTYFRAWKRAEDRNALRKGIIKLINKTDVWIIDHGLNCGLAKLVGEAVRSQRVTFYKRSHTTSHRQHRQRHRRQTKSVTAGKQQKSRGVLDREHHKGGTCLLGIVPELLLTNACTNGGDRGFDYSAGDNASKPQFSSEQHSRRSSQQQKQLEFVQSGNDADNGSEIPSRYEVGQDHNAFVLVENADYVRTAAFRAQFERALQRGAVERKIAASAAVATSWRQRVEKKGLLQTKPGTAARRPRRHTKTFGKQPRPRRGSTESSLSSSSSSSASSSDMSLDELVERNVKIDSDRRHKGEPDDENAAANSTAERGIYVDKVPLVCCLLQGGPPEIDHVLLYLRDRVPVVCLKGTGLIADLLAFAYEEIVERGGGTTKLSFLSATATTNPGQPHPIVVDAMSAVKPELSRRLSHIFPRQFVNNDAIRNVYRDRLLECVKLAFQDGHQYLTVVDIESVQTDLADLDLFILRALFSSRMRNLSRLQRRDREDLMRKHLILCVSWNRADVARYEIFYHSEWDCMQVDYHIFELALLLKGREEFVDLFLSQKYHLYKHLTHRSLLRLFRKADDRSFFLTIVWERILGKSKRSQVKQRFVFEDINWVIETLTGMQDFLNVYELSMFNYGVYIAESSQRIPVDAQQQSFSNEYERKALNAFICWSVLLNRSLLTQALWKYCETPLPMALFISAMYTSLSTYCHDEAELERQVLNNAQYFSSAAVELLDKAFRDNETKAFDALGEMCGDFNNLTPLQIAFGAHDRHFLGHTACQRWLTDAFWGGLTLRTINFPFPITIPQSIKILTSALFFLPSFFWLQIRAKPHETRALFSSAVRGTIISSKRQSINVQPFEQLARICDGDVQENLEDGVSKKQTSDRHHFAENKKHELGVNNLHFSNEVKAKSTTIQISSCPSDADTSSSSSTSEKDEWDEVERLPSSYTDLSRTAPHEVHLWQTQVLTAQRRTRNNRNRYFNFWPRDNANRRRTDRRVSLIARFVMIWTAPVAKFHIYQLLWWALLALLSLQASRTGCLHGAPIDVVVLIFGISFLLENIEQRIREQQVRLKLSPMRYLDFVTFFIVPIVSLLLFTLEPQQTWPPFDDYSLRMINGFIALYYFYRYIFIFYAIDRRIGSMLVRINYMVTHDLSAWFKLVIPPMIGSSILIQSALYPNWHVWESSWFISIAYRGLLSVFALQTDSIFQNVFAQPSSECQEALQSPLLNRGSCWLSNNGTTPCSVAPNFPSSLAYFQYLMLIQLIMSTLLYAMFYATYDAIKPDSDNIWRYEYYRTVVGFACHSPVPPPFNILRYLYVLGKFFAGAIRSCCCCQWCAKLDRRCVRTVFDRLLRRNKWNFSSDVLISTETSTPFTADPTGRSSPQHQQTLSAPTAYTSTPRPPPAVETRRTTPTEQELTYWMLLARDLHNERESLARSGGGALQTGISNPTADGSPTAAAASTVATTLDIVLEELEANAAFNARIRDRMLALEKITNGSRVYLESIKHQLDRQDVNGVVSRKGRLLHIQSRTSPYPGTTIGRFHVFDKHVPWEGAYDVYDPPTYTMPREAFKQHERDFVDPEIDLMALEQQQLYDTVEKTSHQNMSLMAPDNQHQLEKPDYVGDEAIPAVQPASVLPVAFDSHTGLKREETHSFQAGPVLASAEDDDDEDDDDEDGSDDENTEDDEEGVELSLPDILTKQVESKVMRSSAESRPLKERVSGQNRPSDVSHSDLTSSVYMASIDFGLLPPANSSVTTSAVQTPTPSSRQINAANRQVRRRSTRKNLTLDYAKSRRIKRKILPKTNSPKRSLAPTIDENAADKDLLTLANVQRRRNRRPTIELQFDEREQFKTDTRRAFLFNWNTVTRCGDDGGATLDRRSWIVARDGQGLIYRINALGRPMNPMGRTGLAGRGALPRYGPNHAVYLTVTRIHEQQISDVEVRKIVQVLVLRDEEQQQPSSNVCSLPMSYVFGTHPVPVVACKLLMSLFKAEREDEISPERRQVLSNSVHIVHNGDGCAEEERIVIPSAATSVTKRSDVPNETIAGVYIDDVDDEIKMAKLMQSFLFPKPRTPNIEQRLKFEQQPHVQEELTFKGYSDDPRNTDNAWLEVTAFSIHLTSDGASSQLSELDARLVSSVRWKDANALLKMFGNELAFVEQVCSQLDIPMR